MSFRFITLLVVLILTLPTRSDSGAQYFDGTCDTTRTMHFGRPTTEMCEAYTRVLQGHVRIDFLGLTFKTLFFIPGFRPIWGIPPDLDTDVDLEADYYLPFCRLLLIVRSSRRALQDVSWTFWRARHCGRTA